MIEWINARFGVRLAEADLIHVKNFSLVWNIFEDTVCNRFCNVQAIEAAYQNMNFDIGDFQSFLDYFQNRYISGGATNHRFTQLHFRNGDRENLVRDVLLGNTKDVRQIVTAITIIIFRFRNNLFHGEKDIRLINEQDSNFLNSNGFLKVLLTNYFRI